jgi:hypothetical protein
MDFDDQHAAAAVDSNAGGRDNLQLGRNPLENQPRIERSRRRTLGPITWSDGQ